MFASVADIKPDLALKESKAGSLGELRAIQTHCTLITPRVIIHAWDLCPHAPEASTPIGAVTQPAGPAEYYRFIRDQACQLSPRKLLTPPNTFDLQSSSAERSALQEARKATAHGFAMCKRV